MFSDRYNALYVHIPKTGGQSIEHVFVTMHGLKWKNRESLLLRENDEPGGRAPRHLAHLYASEYRDRGYLTAERFACALKFATIRNPYDRARSEFKYRNRGALNSTVSEADTVS
jgi:hypothetical protein